MVSNPLVLVIDHDPRTPTLLLGTAPLTGLRFTVRAAVDGVRAQRALREAHPDLIVLADDLPGRLSWQETIQALRAGGCACPVILLATGEIDEKQALGLGVRQVLERPVTAPLLRQSLTDAMLDVRYRLNAPSQAATNETGLPPLSREFEVLYAVGTSFTATANFDELVHRVVDTAVYVTESEAGRLLLWDEDDGAVLLRAVKNHNDPLAHTVRLAVDDAAADRVLDIRQPLRLHGQDLRDLEVNGTAALYVPLQTVSAMLGVLAVSMHHTAREYTERDQRLMKAVADYAAIAIHNARLLQHLQDRNQTLEAALRRVQEADQLKATIIQNLSHELRTPLVFIKGYVDMLHDGDMAPLPEALGPGVEKLQRRVNDLVGMIDNAVTIHEPDLLHIKREATVLQEVVSEAIAAMNVAATRAQVVMVSHLPTAPLQVLGDRVLLGRLFRNLFDNAIKFSPDGGLVTIHAAQLNAEWVQVTLSDSGVGVPPDKLAHIFEPFYVVDGSERRRFGGAGLGLTAARQIVEALGGMITAESIPGSGTIFKFTLPCVVATTTG